MGGGVRCDVSPPRAPKVGTRGALVFQVVFFIGINNSYTVTSPNTARQTTGTKG